MINHEALANAADLNDRSLKIRLTARIDPGELAPYRADLIEWGHSDHLSISPAMIDTIIRYPKRCEITVPNMFRWMRQHQRGPWAPPPAPEVVTVAGGFHVGDSVTIDRGTTYPRTAQVIATPPGPGRSELVQVRSAGRDEWWHINRTTLDSCPHPAPVPPAEPTEEPKPEGYIPWGPGHPDWDPFWEKAHGAATRLGYCTEYERVVEEVGGPPRFAYEEIEMVITVKITAKVDRGTDPDPTELLAEQQWGSLIVEDSTITNRRPVR